MESFDLGNSNLTVERVSSKEIGDYLALKALNKKAPYRQEMQECKKVPLCETDVVVDIGAFVGEYAMRAAKAGVKQVRAYEPTPTTYSILKENLKKFENAIAINKAVVGNGQKEIDFYISTGNGTRNRINATRGKKITVSADSFLDAVKGCTVLKIDVEGAEWDYPILEAITPELKGIIIEFHPKREEHRKLTEMICDGIEKAGFTMVYPKTPEKFWERYETHGKTWSANRAWIRK